METYNPNLSVAEPYIAQLDAVARPRFEAFRTKAGALALTASALLSPQFMAESAVASSDSVVAASIQEKSAARCADVDLVAHRGDLRRHTENTLGAFQDAIVAGADKVELDLQLTTDNVPVVMHDPEIDRTTRGHGLVADKSYAELSKVRTNDGQRIPTFEQVIKLVRNKKTSIQAELKYNPTVVQMKKIRDVISDYGMSGRVMLTSFNRLVLRKYHTKVDALQPLGVISKTALPLGRLRWARSVLYGEQAATRANVKAAHRAGFKVGVWTPNESSTWNRFAPYIDALTTDKARAFRKWCGGGQR